MDGDKVEWSGTPFVIVLVMDDEDGFLEMSEMLVLVV